MKNLMPRDSSWKIEIICNHPKVENPLQKVFQTYVKRQVDNAYNLSMNEESKCLFTYTAMHGVGYRYVREVFQNLKFEVNYIIFVLIKFTCKKHLLLSNIRFLHGISSR